MRGPDTLMATSNEALFDAAVVGAGLAGLSAALALAETGLRIALVGPCEAARAGQDTRTSALFSGAIRLLQNLGVAHRGNAEPLRAIRIIDDTGRLLRAPETLFRAEEIGLDAFGANLTNGPLAVALLDAIGACANITVIDTRAVVRIEPRADVVALCTTEGRALSARLVAAADGRKSLARQAAGIACRTWGYDQTAIACSFAHSRPHEGISNELHRAAGPLTTVPLPGQRSSLVWVEQPMRARELMSLAEPDFSRTLETRLGGLLGAIDAPGPRATFELAGLSAATLASNRIALVGEAGHALPPIGAQGLNLGLRDVAELADCAAANPQDPGAPAVLEAYVKARRTDIWSRMTAVDLLNRSLLSALLPAQMVRGAGLHALNAVGPLRRLVMREGMEPQGALPRLMRP